MFRPQYRYTDTVVRNLLRVETARAAVDVLPLPEATARDLRATVQQALLEAVRRLDEQPPSGISGALGQIRAKASESLDEGTIQSLAATLVGRGNVAYRGNAKMLYNPSRTELIYIPPEAAEVPRLIADLVDWLAGAWDILPAVVLAGITQQELLLIQPFEQHNNPLAWLAGHAVLTRKGYGFGGFATVEAEMAEHSEAYEHASRSSHAGVHSTQADFTIWLEYFSAQVAAAADRARDEVLVRSKPAELQMSATAPNLPVVLRDRHLKALQYMRENGAIRSGEYQGLAGIVPDTARRDFDELMGKGLIEVRGVGRGTHYVLTQRGMDEAERRRPG